MFGASRQCMLSHQPARSFQARRVKPKACTETDADLYASFFKRLSECQHSPLLRLYSKAVFAILACKGVRVRVSVGLCHFVVESLLWFWPVSWFILFYHIMLFAGEEGVTSWSSWSKDPLPKIWNPARSCELWLQICTHHTTAHWTEHPSKLCSTERGKYLKFWSGIAHCLPCASLVHSLADSYVLTSRSIFATCAAHR